METWLGLALGISALFLFSSPMRGGDVQHHEATPGSWNTQSEVWADEKGMSK